MPSTTESATVLLERELDKALKGTAAVAGPSSVVNDLTGMVKKSMSAAVGVLCTQPLLFLPEQHISRVTLIFVI